MTTTIGKTDLARRIADVTGMSHAAATRVLDAMVAEIRTITAEGGTVSIPGFGKFQTKTRAARTGRNPRTGEAVDVPETRALTFRASKTKAA
jgi:DNA-binding protein HU-beta